MKSGQGRGEGVNHSEGGRGAGGRQKAETTRGRSAPGQRTPLSPTTSWRGHWPAQPIILSLHVLGCVEHLYFLLTFHICNLAETKRLYFFFNLWILAVILGGPHVPSTPRWYYKIGSSGFGEARAWLRCDALFWKRIEISVFFWDRRSQSRGHSFTTWYNSLLDSA